MKIKDVVQIEINEEQPEDVIVQRLVDLGFIKYYWDLDIETKFVEVYLGLNSFSNYSSDIELSNVISLLNFTNIIYENRK